MKTDNPRLYQLNSGNNSRSMLGPLLHLSLNSQGRCKVSYTQSKVSYARRQKEEQKLSVIRYL